MEGSHVIQKHVHLHIFASGQIFPGPRKLIHQTLSCPHSFVKDLRNTIVTKSHYPVQGFQAKMDLNAAVFRRFHALMLGTGPTGISYWALTGTVWQAALHMLPLTINLDACLINAAKVI